MPKYASSPKMGKCEKPCKIKEKPTYKEKCEHDKNTFCVPRQYTNRARKPLIFLDFLKLTEKIYYLFTTY